MTNHKLTQRRPQEKAKAKMANLAKNHASYGGKVTANLEKTANIIMIQSADFTAVVNVTKAMRVHSCTRRHSPKDRRKGKVER